MSRSHRRRRMGRVVIVVPSLFTLANLFFGIWAIVLAAQGDFYRASWWIVIAGVLDVMDGLSARVSKTGTKFGAELDSLTDLVSFGVAPAMLMYHLHLSTQGPFAWIFGYGFVVCVALRLARFNIAPESEAPKAGFTGLPSPAAGMTLATYYPFTQTEFYQVTLAGWPWNQILIFLIIALALAMVSNIRYARLPRLGIRSVQGLVGLAFHVTVLAFGIWARDVFFFPLGIAYLSYGMIRAAVTGVVDRNDDDGEDSEDRPRHLPFVMKSKQARKRPGGQAPPASHG